jgi:selenide,water dikinase
VLSKLPRITDPNVLVGIDTADDAGVYRLNDETALIQTLDFFTPIVDDPYLFGQIAATNSLSDVYAMGGKPLTAMNIVTFPICQLPPEVLLAILSGGQQKIAEAGAVMLGGHTIDDDEPKYGLSVTGVVHPDKVLTNAGARPGDALILTKAIGTGVLYTALKAELFPDGVAAAAASMTQLNRYAAEVMERFPVHACTDITGFGLLGHAFELAVGSAVDLELDSRAVPLLPDAAAAAGMGLVPAGAYANRDYLKQVNFQPEVPVNLQDLLFDPQTSGGLLISLAEDLAANLLAELHAAGVAVAACIGRVTGKGTGKIDVR